jgi:putative tricarboxylic transport membrane protein
LGARFFAKMTTVPKPILWPTILTLCVIGTYASEGTMLPAYTVVVFGIFGYLMKKAALPTAPLILGVLLGPMAEENLRRSLLMNHMDITVFFTRPISLVLLTLGVITLVWPWFQEWYQNRMAQKIGVDLTKEEI